MGWAGWASAPFHDQQVCKFIGIIAEGNDPELARPIRVLAQLEQQFALAQDENHVVRRQRWVKQHDGGKQLVESPKRVKRWWRTDAAGNSFFILRNGNKLVSIAD